MQFFYKSFTCAASLLTMLAAGPAPAQTGGFTEPMSSSVTRPTLSPSQIQSFLPQRGKFTFPAPYNTEGVRVTNAGDCGGNDCVSYVGYSYWRNSNYHVNDDHMLVFFSLLKHRGGGGPTLFKYNKKTDELIKVGPMFDDSDSNSSATAEGWYFSGSMPTKIYLNKSRSMLRYDVITRQYETVFDITSQYGTDKNIWQLHSSDDDRIHSASLRKNTGGYVGCLVYDEPNRNLRLFPGNGSFDECHVDKSGRWLAMMENQDGAYGIEMRVIDLQTGEERSILDQNGALGHLDMGHGYAVGADNWNNKPNATVLLKFPLDTTKKPAGDVVHYNKNWGEVAANHVAHGNARRGLSPEYQFACGSDAGNTSVADEVVCFNLNGSGDQLVVAPIMTNTSASGGGGDSYSKKPKGNLDVTGKYFIWTSNMGGSRLDAFIVKVPSQLLTGGVAQEPMPAEPATANSVEDGSGEDPATGGSGEDPATGGSGDEPATGGSDGGTGTGDDLCDTTECDNNLPVPSTFQETTAPVSNFQDVIWIDVTNLQATGGTLVKTSGCDGCLDAGAASQQVIDERGGYLQFKINDISGLRYIGLTSHHSSTSSSEIEFALRIQGSTAEVRESGQYSGDTAVSNGDTFKIAVENGQIRYYRNGSLFHTSSRTPTFPLRADTSFGAVNASIENAMVATAAASATTTTVAGSSPAPAPTTATAPAPAPAPASAPSPAPVLGDITWTEVTNMYVNGGMLLKNAGCNGCLDSGAVSQQSLTSQGGYLQFKIDDADKLRYVGLTNSHTGTSSYEIDFGLRIQAGTAEVRESGQYRKDTGASIGDVFRVAVESGKVNYYRNGTLFFTSGKQPLYPLRADTSFGTLNASITEAMMMIQGQ